MATLLFIGKDLAGKLLTRYFLIPAVNRENAWKMGEVVHPVTNVDGLVRFPKLYKCGSGGITAAIATTAAGWYTLFTVPAGKRWIIQNFHVFRGAGTINTADKVAINDMIIRMEVKGFTASSNYQSELTQKHIMDAGWRFEVEIATGEAASTFGSVIEVEEEDAD